MDIMQKYPRITITLEPSVFAKLPERDRSAFINVVLKHHFQKDSIEQIYEYVKAKLLRDKDINEWIEITVKEVR